MRNLTLFVLPLIFCIGSSFGQGQDRADASPGTEAPLPSPSPAPRASAGSAKFGIAVSASTLGAGIQAAVPVSRTDDVRVGFNYFTYSHDFDKDGITYHGTLNLRSAEILFDQYLGGAFHITGGTMIYDGNKGTANANVPGGQSFTLGGTTYYSDSANPVNGSGRIGARKIAPELLIGFGNMLPRNQKHFTANFELGVVFQGSPSATLQLNGNTCTGPGTQCLNIASNPTAQASILSEQTKINNSLSVFKYYPVVRLSFGYKF